MTVQWSTAVRNVRLDAWQLGAIAAGNSSIAWAQSTSYTALASRIQNGGNTYICITSGTSASSGSGPSGAGANITDGTAHWCCVGPFVWATSTAYAVNVLAVNGGNVYLCITAGTSASSGTGPSSTSGGIGAAITDGSCVWAYVGEAGMGPGVILSVLTGAQPATCASSDSGTLLVSFTLPTNYASIAASGAKALSGLPMTAVASAGGTAAHYQNLLIQPTRPATSRDRSQ